MPISDDSIQLECHRMRFQHCGRGPAIVLVHGLLGYSFSWRKLMPLLKDREVFAVDMLGSGLSDCSADLDASLEAAARRLVQFLDAVAIAQCDLVGSSYGGATAIMTAALHPERVRSLVLVSPANPWSKIGRKRLAALRLAPVGRLFPRIARRLKILNRLFVKRMYGDPQCVSDETIAGYSIPLARAGVFEHSVQIACSWKKDMARLQEVLPGAIDIPCLIVWGEKDRLVSRASADVLAHKFRQPEVVVLRGLGHLPYEEAPEAFAASLLEFLAEHSPTQGPHGK